MVADVNEANIAKIREGQQAEVVADALPERKYRGAVRQIVPTADRTKGIVQVKVRLAELDGLLPEMAARATFLRDGAAATGAKRVMAPKGAVRDRGGAKVVFVLEGTRVRAVAVDAGPEGEDGVEIRKGLAGGETVVVAGEVEDGTEVAAKRP
jgi:multidrug efflux pump subunit AcrA (membrane-fusion protein)